MINGGKIVPRKKGKQRARECYFVLIFLTATLVKTNLKGITLSLGCEKLFFNPSTIKREKAILH